MRCQGLKLLNVLLKISHFSNNQYQYVDVSVFTVSQNITNKTVKRIGTKAVCIWNDASLFRLLNCLVCIYPKFSCVMHPNSKVSILLHRNVLSAVKFESSAYRSNTSYCRWLTLHLHCPESFISRYINDVNYRFSVEIKCLITVIDIMIFKRIAILKKTIK